MKEGAAKVWRDDFSVFAHSACRTVAHYLAQLDKDRGAVQNLFSQNCGYVFCPLCALWALKTSPLAADQPETLGRKKYGVRALKDLGELGDLEGRARAQSDTVSEKTWRALVLHP